jgi:dipeptidyl aminopeptidase/acylaminoacyl peptidase
MRSRILSILLLLAIAPCLALGASTEKKQFQPLDVFDLQWATDPQISPDGKTVVYVRKYVDIMKDAQKGDLWTVNSDGSNHRPLVKGGSSPRWSPDGGRIAYVASDGAGAQIFVRWMDSGAVAQVTRLQRGPGALAWSPDGKTLAFVMGVPEETKPLGKPLAKPEGAEWAPPLKVIEKLIYREDGAGYLPDERAQVFVVAADGGTPRQLTSGSFDHGGPLAWTPDGQSIVLSANRRKDAESEPLDSEVHEIRVADGTIRALTSRHGPDASPDVSRDGKQIAWTGFDDKYQGYQVARLSVMNRAGGTPRVVSAGFDRSVDGPRWSPDGREIVFQYDDEGAMKLAAIALDGKVRTIAKDLGGLSLGRPYASGDFSMSKTGMIAYTEGGPERLADVAVVSIKGGAAKRLTNLSGDLLAQRDLGQLYEMWVKSSFDGKRVQAWMRTPAGFDRAKKYPLLLEIHGGPFAAYGPTFSTDVQLYASAGYIVVYSNPRGSTGYGEAFGNAIHHAYPGHDYEDLMSVVDAAMAKGSVDPDRLFVTGGSGGGVLSAWIVGKTDRFRAAVVQKPVIDWTSFALTSDDYNFYWKYWFSGYPWDKPEEYYARSPISLVGNVKTPTMLLTGEQDFRCPISEAEQFYQALKLRGVPTALVRVPGAGHNLDARPSQGCARVADILAWFERHDPKAGKSEGGSAEVTARGQ